MPDQRPLVVVVDGHGGGMGKALVARLRERLPQVHVRAVGTNSAATEAMLKGGAEDGATGENAVIFNVGKADFVVGSVAIVMANGLMGEISPRMAQAVGESDAIKVLIPANRCGIRMAVGRSCPCAATWTPVRTSSPPSWTVETGSILSAQSPSFG